MPPSDAANDAPVSGLTSVIVVACDSGPLLQQCLDAVLGTDAKVEVVLVDNASSDGEVERAEQRFVGDARFRLLRNGANLGFGTACNRGAAIACGDVALILNPDCIIQHDTIREIRRILDARPDIGLLGVAVTDPDGTLARGNRRRDPTLRRAFMTMSGLARFETRCPALAGVEMLGACVGISPIEPVEAVSGACMALPKAVFDELGGFDEGYFLHVEDLDLCRRVRDGGRSVAIAHDLRVMHAQGSSSRHRSAFVARHKHDSMWRYFTKFDSGAGNILARVLVRTGLAMRQALLTIRLVMHSARRRH